MEKITYDSPKIEEFNKKFGKTLILRKNITRTLKFQFPATSHKELSDVEQVATFTRKANIDIETGSVSYDPWEPQNTFFESYDVPRFDGFESTQKVIDKKAVSPHDNNETVIVVYMPNDDSNQEELKIQRKAPNRAERIARKKAMLVANVDKKNISKREEELAATSFRNDKNSNIPEKRNENDTNLLKHNDSTEINERIVERQRKKLRQREERRKRFEEKKRKKQIQKDKTNRKLLEFKKVVEEKVTKTNDKVVRQVQFNKEFWYLKDQEEVSAITEPVKIIGEERRQWDTWRQKLYNLNAE